MSSIHVTNVKDASGNAALVTESGGVKTDKLTGITTAGSISVVGEGNSTTTNLQQGLIKMWADLSGGGSPAIDDSLNTSSVTDVASGERRINLSNSMGNTNYMVIAGMINDGNSGGTRGAAGSHLGTQATGSVQYKTLYGSTGSSDGAVTDSHTQDGCGIAGDLA